MAWCRGGRISLHGVSSVVFARQTGGKRCLSGAEYPEKNTRKGEGCEGVTGLLLQAPDVFP